MKLKDRYEYDPRADKLGEGGFGKVFKAKDLLLKREIAIKLVEASRLPDRYSLVDEISKAVGLNHPNLVRYYDAMVIPNVTNAFGEEDDIQIGVMEYIKGGDLKDYLAKNPSNEEKEEIIIGILKGLSYLNKKGIVHRDIKPANILMSFEDGEVTPKIVDFGISKRLKTEATISGVMGTYEYLPPEQIGDTTDNRLHQNSDLWSLGVMVYEIFTGELPFGSRSRGTTDSEIISNIIDGHVPPLVNQIPEPFQTVVRRCLIKNPNLRIKDADAVLDIINNYDGADISERVTEDHHLAAKEAKSRVNYDSENKNKKAAPIAAATKPKPKKERSYKGLLYAGIFLLLGILGFTLVQIFNKGEGGDAKDEVKSAFKFNTTLHDFGELKQGSINNNHIFDFKNEQNEAIRIIDVKTSCDCLTIDFPKEPIEPGTSAQLKASLDAGQLKPGGIKHDITIKTDPPYPVYKLFMEGNIGESEAVKDLADNSKAENPTKKNPIETKTTDHSAKSSDNQSSKTEPKNNPSSTTKQPAQIANSSNNILSTNNTKRNTGGNVNTNPITSTNNKTNNPIGIGSSTTYPSSSTKTTTNKTYDASGNVTSSTTYTKTTTTNQLPSTTYTSGTKNNSGTIGSTTTPSIGVSSTTTQKPPTTTTPPPTSSPSTKTSPPPPPAAPKANASIMGRTVKITDASQIYSDANKVRSDCIKFPSKAIKKKAGKSVWKKSDYYPKNGTQGKVIFESQDCSSKENVVILQVDEHYIAIKKRGVK